MTNEYPLYEPIQVRSSAELGIAKAKLADKDSIRSMTYLTYEMNPNKLINMSEFLTETSKIHSISIEPRYIGISGTHKCTKYYSVSIQSTQEELELITPLMQKVINREKELSKNSNIEDSKKHNQFIQSTSGKAK